MAIQSIHSAQARSLTMPATLVPAAGVTTTSQNDQVIYVQEDKGSNNKILLGAIIGGVVGLAFGILGVKAGDKEGKFWTQAKERIKGLLPEKWQDKEVPDLLRELADKLDKDKAGDAEVKEEQSGEPDSETN